MVNLLVFSTIHQKKRSTITTNSYLYSSYEELYPRINGKFGLLRDNLPSEEEMAVSGNFTNLASMNVRSKENENKTLWNGCFI